MRTKNQVNLLGYAGQDLEVKILADARKIASVNMAMSKSYIDKTTGQRVENTTWIKVVFYGKAAEVAEACKLKKGDAFAVTGSLQNEEWKDKDGNQRYGISVGVNYVAQGDFCYIGKIEKPVGTPQSTQSAPQSAPQTAKSFDDFDDDIPFDV